MDINSLCLRSYFCVLTKSIVVAVIPHQHTIQKHSRGLSKRASLLLTNVGAHRHRRAYQLYIVSDSRDKQLTLGQGHFLFRWRWWRWWEATAVVRLIIESARHKTYVRTSPALGARQRLPAQGACLFCGGRARLCPIYRSGPGWLSQMTCNSCPFVLIMSVKLGCPQ